MIWKVILSLIGKRITQKTGAEVMIIKQNVGNKKTTEYRTTFFNVTKEMLLLKQQWKELTKDHPSTFGTPKKRQPHLGPDFGILQSSVKKD